MGAIFLLTMPQVLRDAGLDVDTFPGWETRARLSGGYDAVLAVQVHHTVSNTTPLNDMNYMWRNAADKPIGAIHLARDGKWTVGAAGATNTSGRGGPLQTSKGYIPLDAANRYVISIEAANDGRGEVWPVVQQDSYVKGVAALCKAYGISSVYPDVHAHHEWTSRKIDPAGNSRYATGANKWNMSTFRADVSQALAPKPPVTQPPEEEEDMSVKTYIAIPPEEFSGLEWMFVSSMVRPANSFDVEDGHEQRLMQNIKGKNLKTQKLYRVEQYEAMYRSAGLGEPTLTKP